MQADKNWEPPPLKNWDPPPASKTGTPPPSPSPPPPVKNWDPPPFQKLGHLLKNWDLPPPAKTGTPLFPQKLGHPSRLKNWDPPPSPSPPPPVKNWDPPPLSKTGTPPQKLGPPSTRKNWDTPLPSKSGTPLFPQKLGGRPPSKTGTPPAQKLERSLQKLGRSLPKTETPPPKTGTPPPKTARTPEKPSNPEKNEHPSNWTLKLETHMGPHTGPLYGTLTWDPQTAPCKWTLELHPRVGSPNYTPKLLSPLSPPPPPPKNRPSKLHPIFCRQRACKGTISRYTRVKKETLTFYFSPNPRGGDHPSPPQTTDSLRRHLEWSADPAMTQQTLEQPHRRGLPTISSSKLVQLAVSSTWSRSGCVLVPADG